MQALQLSLKALGIDLSLAPPDGRGVPTLAVNTDVLVNFAQDDSGEHVVAYSSPGLLPVDAILGDIERDVGDAGSSGEESGKRVAISIGDERAIVLLRVWSRAQLDARGLLAGLAGIETESRAWASALGNIAAREEAGS